MFLYSRKWNCFWKLFQRPRSMIIYLVAGLARLPSLDSFNRWFYPIARGICLYCSVLKCKGLGSSRVQGRLMTITGSQRFIPECRYSVVERIGIGSRGTCHTPKTRFEPWWTLLGDQWATNGRRVGRQSARRYMLGSTIDRYGTPNWDSHNVRSQRYLQALSTKASIWQNSASSTHEAAGPLGSKIELVMPTTFWKGNVGERPQYTHTIPAMTARVDLYFFRRVVFKLQTMGIRKAIITTSGAIEGPLIALWKASTLWHLPLGKSLFQAKADWLALESSRVHNRAKVRRRWPWDYM